MAEQINEVVSENKTESRDATIQVLEDKARLKASVVVEPPMGTGEHVTVEQLQERLRQKGITFGIQEDQLRRIQDQKLYESPVVVAIGQPAVDGKDGKVRELFAREYQLSFKEREDGTIDFKEMNIVVNVSKGDVICEITPVVPGQMGTDIYGAALKPYSGKPPIVPQGENTVLSEDGLKLLSDIDGSLIFRKGRFCVDSVFTVHGDVDAAIGNINFNGDVVVKGNVQEGFEIHSKGSVRVDGVVEGASIYADGSILLTNGMNGMNHGILSAKGDVTSKHLENCSICAGGNIKAESIINCKVESDGSMEVSGKRGKIAGGKLTVFGSIKASQIGSNSSAQTTIVLGVTPTILKERAALEEELKQLSASNLEMDKNLSYLTHQETQGRLSSPEHKKTLNKIRLQAPVLKMKEAKLRKQISELSEQMLQVNACTLTCGRIYPTTKITIGNTTSIIKDIVENCRLYRDSKGEIAIGKL